LPAAARKMASFNLKNKGPKRGVHRPFRGVAARLPSVPQVDDSRVI
jgi:hypothetical protein